MAKFFISKTVHPRMSNKCSFESEIALSYQCFIHCTGLRQLEVAKNDNRNLSKRQKMAKFYILRTVHPRMSNKCSFESEKTLSYQCFIHFTGLRRPEVAKNSQKRSQVTKNGQMLYLKNGLPQNVKQVLIRIRKVTFLLVFHKLYRYQTTRSGQK